ncbi:3-hydroxyacyl-CoA dehydrogenase NAD-binding domain-containing protein, partial [Nocardioides sp.]|uniref:3-hydroxyacyl-CoA dehydrogenase NAD-binding domain-containing protein n=1 Tax=Nocardioides sp. TaxID=35761 RepID=UPI0025EAE186
MRPAPEDVRTVACVGAGVIGGGWAAYFLARGYDVVALTELGLADGASRDHLVVESDLAAACARADFVQESAPEDLELKRRLLADIDAVTPADVVVSSSTSGYPMSEMQDRCAHP